MNKLIYNSILLSCATAGVIGPKPVLAQGSIALEEIVVTARRREERLQDVPISITVFDQKQIDKRNIINPSDLATYTPSLAANRQYGTAKSSFAIRGFVQELGTQPSVGVYFADVVAPRAQGPTTSGSGTMPGTMFDLQNVQVLKGPQGTLFGRNTTGGAVLFVPQKPTEVFEGYIEGSAGNYDMQRVQGVLNVPVSDALRVRLAADQMTRDGYLDNGSGIGPDEFADVDYLGLRASVIADLTPTLENYTIVTFNNSDTNGDLGRMIACARDPSTRTPSQFLAGFGCAQLDRQAARGDDFYGVENDVPDPQVDLEQWQFINTTTWEATDTLTIKNIFSYSEFEEETRKNLFGDRLLLPVSATLTLPFRLSAIEPGPSGVNASQYTATEELQFQGRTSDDRLVWQAGGYFETSKPMEDNTQLNQLFMNCTDAANLNCIPALGAISSLSLLDQRFEFRNLGAYAQSTYRFNEQFSLTTGIRYTKDRIEARAQNAAVRFIPGLPAPFISCTKTGVPIASLEARDVCRETFKEESSKPTWLIGVEYEPTDNTLVYAKYARGYRQGTINLLPLSDSLTTTGPEEVDTYEIGVKTNFEGAISGSFNIAAFYNDFSEQQLQANTIVREAGIFPANVIVNAGKSRIQGIEADLSVQLFEGFRLDAAYAYLDTELESISFPDLYTDPFYSGLGYTAEVGGPLALSPENRVTVTATYTLPLDESVGRVSFGATYTHTDEQFANHASDAFAFQVGFNPGLLPATDLLNLNLDWADIGGKPVDMSLFATNVTNEEYRNYGGALMQLGYDSAILGEPRMVGLRLRYRFGG